MKITKKKLKLIIESQSTLNQTLDSLKFPLKFSHGVIMDGSGMSIIKANRDSGTTPLTPAQRDSLLQLTTDLLNDFYNK